MPKQKMKKVKCSSGLVGLQYKFQDSYASFEEFAQYAEIYNLHKRLGYRTILGAWKSNPTVQSSVEPSDFRKVRVIK